MASTDYPICKLCVPPRRHALTETHIFPPIGTDKSEPMKVVRHVSQIKAQAETTKEARATSDSRSDQNTNGRSDGKNSDRPTRITPAATPKNAVAKAPPPRLDRPTDLVPQVTKTTQSECFCETIGKSSNGNGILPDDKHEKRLAQIRNAVARYRAKKRALKEQISNHAKPKTEPFRR